MADVLPQLMSKIWDGDSLERFTHVDMLRIQYNANLLAEYAGVPTVEYIETTRASQFRYDEAIKLEGHIQAIADAVGVSVEMDTTTWAYNRALTYVDFERWESALWLIYQALGGIGERIEAGTVLVIYEATLFADSWLGTGPYHIDLTLPAVHPEGETVAFVSCSASLDQRMAEYNAWITVQQVTDRLVRVRALRRVPRVDLPYRFAIGGFQHMETLTIPASAWTGEGPYTATITLAHSAADAVVGTCDTTTDDQATQLMTCGVCAGPRSGTSLTVRALLDKPTIDLVVGVAYNTTEIE